MFPAASPNSQFLNGLPSGGATPGTLDFHRAALSAAAANKAGATSNYSMPNNKNITSNVATTQAESANQFANMDQKPQQPATREQYGEDADAANGLYMLAQSSTGSRNGSQFGQSQPPSIQTSINDAGNHSVETSPLSRRATNKDSIGSIPASAETGEGSDSAASEQKPATRSRGGKKGAANGKAANNRRKAEDAPAKPPASKKAKANTGMPMEEDFSEDESMMPDVDANGKKMTDEEKRKNFLERNRYVTIFSQALIRPAELTFLPESRRSNADNARSNGCRISRTKWSSTRPRTTPCQVRFSRFVRRLSTSRRFSWHTRTALSPMRRASTTFR
jgi:ATF/CREB family transcription factor